MNLRLIIFSIIYLFSFNSYSQKNECNLDNDNNNKIYAIDFDDMICLSKKSSSANTIFYTFGIWCAPCIKHLDNTIAINENYDVDLYILLTENENDTIIKKTVEYLKKRSANLNILTIKDSYGKRKSKKYKKFLKEITPNRFKNINGMSKYILLNNAGEIKMITTWKDNIENNWDDDSKMLEKKIIPFLRKK